MMSYSVVGLVKQLKYLMEAQVARCVRRLKQSVSGEEEEARERRDMVSRPLMQTSSTNVYDLDLIGFTESQLLYEIVESQT
ncbi:hypothetical protein Bca4012_056142 [Brassica carinata]